MKNHKVPLILLAIYAVVFIWSAINPVDREVWVVEAITSFIPVLILFICYVMKIRVSNFAYILMTFLPVMHVIGAHYTFSEVPFQWFSDLFGYERNMYDRVAHMVVGFYAFGLAEILYVRGLVKNKIVAWTYALFAIMALAATYELFEWWYAVSSDPTAGIAVLGSQGDIWDAQKDMLMDTIGAVIGVVLFAFRKVGASI
jgi:putative membrane protein